MPIILGREVYPDAMQWLSGSPRGGATKEKTSQPCEVFFVLLGVLFGCTLKS